MEAAGLGAHRTPPLLGVRCFLAPVLRRFVIARRPSALALYRVGDFRRMAELADRSIKRAFRDAKAKDAGVIVVNAIDPAYIDFALAMIGVEGLGLLAWRAWTGNGPAPRALIANLTAGTCLLLVARALLTGAGALPTLAALTLALAAHIFDLAVRWEGASQATPKPPEA
jgi:hypothetical protein